jgi:ATP-dependent phosphoenolpyruvate carboxykinase
MHALLAPPLNAFLRFCLISPLCVVQSGKVNGIAFGHHQIHRNLPPSALYEAALHLEPDAAISSTGALVAYSGHKTGRSPKDKRVVLHPESQGNVWWGEASPNQPLKPEAFEKNKARAIKFLEEQDHIFVQDGFVNWGQEVCSLLSSLVSHICALVS